MTIQASLAIWVFCDGESEGCHSLIDTEADPITDNLSQDAYHEWIEQFGWLVIGDLAYCPVCRLELHD